MGAEVADRVCLLPENTLFGISRGKRRPPMNLLGGAPRVQVLASLSGIANTAAASPELGLQKQEYMSELVKCDDPN